MRRGWRGRSYLALVPVLLAAGAALLSVTEDARGAAALGERAEGLDLSQLDDAAPGRALDLLFIHHSCGGQLLAPQGESDGTSCIYRTHPNGGGLREQLQQQGYEVHEASYGSAVGEHTDLFDWVPKFRDQMDEVLRVKHQDERLPDGRQNRVVVFKSCFPNNAFVGEGQWPGDPAGPRLTYWNAQATMKALLPHFERRPDVLFVYVTAPPLAPLRSERGYKWAARKLGLLPGRPSLKDSALLARRFNNWVKAPGGWLEGYAGSNVVVYDYYDLLTGQGRSDLLLYPTQGGQDSHPSSEGNSLSAAPFVPLLNRAVRRAGLLQPIEPI